VKVTFAATQFACSEHAAENLDGAERLVRAAAGRGAQVVLLQELFETPYFCKDHLARHFELARPVSGNPVLERFQGLARELGVVLPYSFFERANNAYFNSLAMIDADGALLGVYRKSHIPEGPGYHEKYYFSPGDTGFRVWRTSFGVLGVGICWDQWFPEAARCMALMGSIRRRSARSRTTPASTRATTGSVACRDTRRPTSCRSSPRTGSASSAGSSTR
jgi:N-carbamoylputrescine amidase